MLIKTKKYYHSGYHRSRVGGLQVPTSPNMYTTWHTYNNINSNKNGVMQNNDELYVHIIIILRCLINSVNLIYLQVHPSRGTHYCGSWGGGLHVSKASSKDTIHSTQWQTICSPTTMPFFVSNLISLCVFLIKACTTATYNLCRYCFLASSPPRSWPAPPRCSHTYTHDYP